MPSYLIAEIKIADDSWVPAYAGSVHEIVHRHGGKYLSRSAAIDTIEGEPADFDVVAILEFPDRAALDAFVADAEYRPFGEARRVGSTSRFRVIDSSDVAGAIPYLDKPA